jgi:hypothetical protein
MMRLNPLWIALLLFVLAGCDAIQPPEPVPDPTPTLLEDPVVDELEATPAEVDAEPVMTATGTITATAAPVTTLDATLTPTTTATVTATPPITGTPTLTVTPPMTGTPTVTVTPPITGTPTATVTPPGTPTVLATPADTPTPTATSTPPPATPTATSPPATPTATPPPATPTATSPPTTPTVTPTITPLPATVSLHKHRSFVDGANRIVVGEVINGARTPVFSVRVIATFYDADNRLVSAQETLAMLPQTQWRQTNPFRIVLANAPANIDHYELSLVWDEISLVEYDRLSIVSESVDQDAGEIVGEVRNDHRLGLRALRVVATLYDAQGEIVDAFVGQTGVAQLAPDETTTFVVRTGAPDLAFDSFLVQTQGVLER